MRPRRCSIGVHPGSLEPSGSPSPPWLSRYYIELSFYRISLRLELYGCNYIPDILHFNGTALIRRDLSRHPVASLRDTFRFRFKTNKENGIILYSRGSQGDYLALQLVENRLKAFARSNPESNLI
jgi:hypothetical protein